MKWRRHWRLSGWGVKTALEGKWLGTGDDVGDFAAGEWRRHWRLRLGTRDDDGDLAAGDQR